MANIKISELNELETRHRNDLLPIVNSSNNETEKIKVENLINENVELIAVSPTAPSECSLGDKYFNTTSNKIYTAIATNTWSSTGENAVEGILYVVFGDQSTYAYNGTTLVSVGGGSGGTITQQSTAPENPEENDLWIDTLNGNSLKRYNGTTWELVSTSSDAPIGTIVPFAGTTAPSDYLLCDGTAVSRTTYSDLFAVIGTTYGAGDGSTTFNLPNLKGRVPVGLDGTDTDFDTIGKIGGSKYLQEHNHEKLYWGNLQTQAGLNSGGNLALKLSYEQGVAAKNNDFITGTAGTGNSGNLQPYLVVHYIIKATKTTPVQAEIINEYSTSTEDGYSCDYVNKLNTYSTDEVKTGDTWIDGKPIYKKTFYYNGTMDNTVLINLDITNMGTFIDYEGSINVASGQQRPIPCFYGPSFIEFYIMLYDIDITLGKITLNMSNWFKNNANFFYITIFYTKTTD